MIARANCRLVWLAWGGSSFLLLASFGLTVSDRGGVGWIVQFGLVQLVFASTGVVLTLRVAANPIGWLFLGFGVLASIAIAGEAYSLRALEPRPNSLPGGSVALVVSSVIYGPGLFAMVLALLMLFPDGRLASRRWRPAAMIAILAGCMFTALQAMSPGSLNSLDPAQSVENPIALGGTARVVSEVLIGLCAVSIVTVMVASLVSLICRLRCATGVLRQQMKWFVGAAALFAATFVAEAPLWNTSREWAQAAAASLFAVGAIALPVATGVAILRYRLYEIDVVIRRTLVYAGLIACLTVLYLGSIAVLGWIFRSATDQYGSVAVTLSTLVVSAAFQPLRSRIQQTVDRRFYRRKYDAAHTLEGFRDRLRDQFDLTALHDEVVCVVTDTLQPTHTTLWLRPLDPQRPG